MTRTVPHAPANSLMHGVTKRLFGWAVKRDGSPTAAAAAAAAASGEEATNKGGSPTVPPHCGKAVVPASGHGSPPRQPALEDVQTPATYKQESRIDAETLLVENLKPLKQAPVQPASLMRLKADPDAAAALFLKLLEEEQARRAKPVPTVHQVWQNGKLRRLPRKYRRVTFRRLVVKQMRVTHIHKQVNHNHNHNHKHYYFIGVSLRSDIMQYAPSSCILDNLSSIRELVPFPVIPKQASPRRVAPGCPKQATTPPVDVPLPPLDLALVARAAKPPCVAPTAAALLAAWHMDKLRFGTPYTMSPSLPLLPRIGGNASAYSLVVMRVGVPVLVPVPTTFTSSLPALQYAPTGCILDTLSARRERIAVPSSKQGIPPVTVDVSFLSRGAPKPSLSLVAPATPQLSAWHLDMLRFGSPYVKLPALPLRPLQLHLSDAALARVSVVHVAVCMAPCSSTFVVVPIPKPANLQAAPGRPTSVSPFSSTKPTLQAPPLVPLDLSRVVPALPNGTGVISKANDMLSFTHANAPPVAGLARGPSVRSGSGTTSTSATTPTNTASASTSSSTGCTCGHTTTGSKPSDAGDGDGDGDGDEQDSHRDQRTCPDAPVKRRRRAEGSQSARQRRRTHKSSDDNESKSFDMAEYCEVDTTPGEPSSMTNAAIGSAAVDTDAISQWPPADAGALRRKQLRKRLELNLHLKQLLGFDHTFHGPNVIRFHLGEAPFPGNIAFHGTADTFVNSIIALGLNPAMSDGPGHTLDPATNLACRDLQHIYLSPSPHYASLYSESEEPDIFIVLEVRVKDGATITEGPATVPLPCQLDAQLPNDRLEWILDPADIADVTAVWIGFAPLS